MGCFLAGGDQEYAQILYAAPDGKANQVGTKERPVDLQTALNQKRDFYMMDGIYTQDRMDMAEGVKVRSADGARPVVVHSNGGPPLVMLNANSEVHGIWFGGKKPEGTSGWTVIIAKPGAKMYDCVLFNCTDGIGGGAGDNNLFHGCRFINCGVYPYNHALYVSTSNNVGAGATVEECIFLASPAYAIHFYHNPHGGRVHNNFTGNAFRPIAFQYEDHIASQNIFWNNTADAYWNTANSQCNKNVWTGAGGTPSVIEDANTGNTAYGNCYMGSTPRGANSETWTEKDVISRLGVSSSVIDDAVAALIKKFATQTVTEIQADATIEEQFAILNKVIQTWKADL